MLYQIPEIDKSLRVVELLQRKRDADQPVRCVSNDCCTEQASLTRACQQATFDFSLSEQAYAKATIRKVKTVNLWLGAQVMLEYELDEAKDLLVRLCTCGAADAGSCTAVLLITAARRRATWRKRRSSYRTSMGSWTR